MIKFSVEGKIAKKKRAFSILRTNMIKKEKLHINEQLNYEAFLKLYSKYGIDLSEEEFAYVFLDYSIEDYRSVKAGYNYPILKNEQIDELYIELLKIYLIKDLELEKGEPISATRLEQIYNHIPTNLSLVLFAEKVLDVSPHSVACIKSNHSKNATIFNKTNNLYFTDKDFNYLKAIASRQIEKRKKLERQLKDAIAIDMNLHMKDKVTCEQFNELYDLYGKGNYTEYEFGRRILGLSETKARNLINKKIKDAGIWKNEYISLDYILELRKKTIEEEKLHINDQIDYKRFKEIYAKHSGILSEIEFAEKVLDISRNSYRELRKRKQKLKALENSHKENDEKENYKSRIFTDIEVPESFWEETRNNIKKSENVYRWKKISYEEFLKLYRKYGYVAWDVDFASKVLQIRPDEFRKLKTGEYLTNRIFISDKEDDYNAEDLRKLRDVVISENKLHIGDSISGKRFEELYNKYGFGMSQKFFGEKILDIESYRIPVILRDETDNSCILTKEPITNEYIKALRNTIFKSGEHHKGDMISYNEFLRLYEIYGGKLSEVQFAKKVLFINNPSLKNIRTDPERKREAEIFCGLKVSDSYIEKLKQNAIKNYLLYSKLRITPAFFNRIYKKSKTILSPADFAKRVLDISQQVYYKSCVKHENESFIILSETETPDNKDKFWSRQEKRLTALLISGYSYREIEAATNFTASSVRKAVDENYQKGVDKIAVRDNYIKSRIKFDKPIEQERIGNFEITSNYLESIKDKIKSEEEFLAQENACRKILDEFKETKNSRKVVNSYVSASIQKFSENFSEMTEANLEILQLALEFLDNNNQEHNQFFINACINKKAFKRANGFISYCLENPDLSQADKENLENLRKQVRDSIRIDHAIHLLRKGTNIKAVMYATDLNEIDVIRLKRNLENSKMADLEKE